MGTVGGALMDTRPVVQQPITLPLTGFLVNSRCTATSPLLDVTVEESGRSLLGW